MDQLFSRFPFLETALWVLAALAAFAAFLVIAPSFFNNPAGTPVALQKTATVRATLTPLRTATPQLAAPPPKLGTPNPIPTPPAGAQILSFVDNPKLSGWLNSGEQKPHWGDRNLHAGQYKGQAYHSVVYFDLSALAPGSQIFFAQIELTGLNRGNLGASGSWTLKLLPTSFLKGWTDHSNSDIAQVSASDQIGLAAGPSDLAEGQTNQFVFGAAQLSQLRQAIDSEGRVAFRIDGPTGTEDNLFTWDGGDPDPSLGLHPVLSLVAVPGQFTFITITPTPGNVLTAAAAIVQSTESARRNGTPTPFPRKFATAIPQQVVTSVPTPANSATALADSFYATAVALTTGTYTPTPDYWVTATSTPVLLTAYQFTPIPSPTPTSFTSRLQLLQTPIPTKYGLSGKILFQTDREGLGITQVWVMNPDGSILGKLSGDEYLRLAENRALFSPDKQLQVDVGKNENDQWQIVLLDNVTGILSPLIPAKGRLGSYQPNWSPLGDKLVYVSDLEGTEELYVYDFHTKLSTRITFTPPNQKTEERAQNNHPSWSPDGKKIVFASNRDPFPLWQIWIVNPDGSDMHRLSSSPSNDMAPNWVR